MGLLTVLALSASSADATPVLVWTPEYAPTISITYNGATASNAGRIDFTWTACGSSVTSTTTQYGVDLTNGTTVTPPFNACSVDIDFVTYQTVSGTQGSNGYLTELDHLSFTLSTSNPDTQVAYSVISGSPSGRAFLSLD